MDYSINEIEKCMINKPLLSEIIKCARGNYRKSLKFLKHKKEKIPECLSPEEIRYIDVDLSDIPVAMYIYDLYTVPKQSGSNYDWAGNDKGIAKHYQCIQLAMFLDGRGVF